MKAVNLQGSFDQVDTSAGQLQPPQKPSDAQDIHVSGPAAARSSTNLTFRPGPQIEKTQEASHGLNPTTAPPCPTSGNTGAAKPIAVPAISEVGQIGRPCNSET